MPTRDGTAGSYHGTTTINTAEVVTLGGAQAVTVVKWDASGDLWWAFSPAGDDIDIVTAGHAGLHRLADGVTGAREIDVSVSSGLKVVLKSSAAVRYTVEKS